MKIKCKKIKLYSFQVIFLTPTMYQACFMHRGIIEVNKIGLSFKEQRGYLWAEFEGVLFLAKQVTRTKDLKARNSALHFGSGDLRRSQMK